MAKTLFARYENVEHARLAVQALVNIGLPGSDVNLLHRTEAETTGLAADPDSVNAGDVDGGAPHTGNRFTTGAGVGALMGGLGGLLIGMGAFFFRGTSSLVGAGRLMVPLLSTWMGTTMGGLLGGVVGMGVPKQPQADPMGVRRIGTLVAVSTPDERVEEVTTVLQRYGTVDIEIENQTDA